MPKEQQSSEDDKPISIRVVMSGEYFMPYNNVSRKKIAIERLGQIFPYHWSKNNSKNKRKIMAEKGIIQCIYCHYPQPIENTICCFCDNILEKK